MSRKHPSGVARVTQSPAATCHHKVYPYFVKRGHGLGTMSNPSRWVAEAGGLQ